MTIHHVTSDIFANEYVVQQIGIIHGKNLLIDTLRDIFSTDRQFKYVTDIFGFPRTPSHLGLDPNAGYDLGDEETTRIFIGSTYRHDIKFNPAIIVKNTSSRYIPISFNQNLMGVEYSRERIVDGYGNETLTDTPTHLTLVGAWDQVFEVKVIAESELDREEIADIVQVTLMGARRLELQNNGLFIKTCSTGGEVEEPYANDFLYTMSINLETRSEWRIHIPVSNVVERIAFFMEFDYEGADDTPAEDLRIKEQLLE